MLHTVSKRKGCMQLTHGHGLCSTSWHTPQPRQSALSLSLSLSLSRCLPSLTLHCAEGRCLHTQHGAVRARRQKPESRSQPAPRRLPCCCHVPFFELAVVQPGFSHRISHRRQDFRPCAVGALLWRDVDAVDLAGVVVEAGIGACWRQQLLREVRRRKQVRLHT